MTDEEWNQGHARCLGAHLSGRGLTERDEHGVPVEDDDLLLLFNAHDEEIAFRLPDSERRCAVARARRHGQRLGRARADDVLAPAPNIRCRAARSCCYAVHARRAEARARDAVRRAP